MSHSHKVFAVHLLHDVLSGFSAQAIYLLNQTAKVLVASLICCNVVHSGPSDSVCRVDALSVRPVRESNNEQMNMELRIRPPQLHLH